MSPKLPTITGNRLIGILKKDGWTIGRKANHGRTMTKKYGNCTRVTFIPETRASLPQGTLMAILSSKQTNLGKEGLIKLINKK